MPPKRAKLKAKSTRKEIISSNARHFSVGFLSWAGSNKQLMIPSEELLAEYAMSQSEEAFQELVNRHISLVYSTALRMANGDAHLAEDISQIVFSDLARQARRIRHASNVAGWLYRHAHFTTLKAIRSERRRQHRENSVMNQESNEPCNEMSEIAPILDDALSRLKTDERDAIVLRFFEKNDFRSIGKLLGVSEDAAQKKVSRALDKLRIKLSAQGSFITATSLTGLLMDQALSAPTFLSSAITANALTAGMKTSIVSQTVGWISSNMKPLILATLLGTAAIPIILQYKQVSTLQTQNHQLHTQVEGFTERQNQAAAEKELRIAEIELLKRENQELHRLRAEVSNLRKELGRKTATDLIKAKVPIVEAPEPPKAPAQVTVETQFITLSNEAIHRTEPFATLERTGVKGSKISLSAEDSQNLIDRLKTTQGVEMTAAPKVTTLDGRQARVSIAESMKFAEQTIDLGPEVDVLPSMAPDGSLSLSVSASFGEFLGWSDPEQQKQPRLRIRKGSDTRAVPNGGSVLLSLSETIAAEAYPETNRLFVLVTPTLIDAAGNRID